MTAEPVGGVTLPAVITLEYLTRMMAADQHGRRYELSPEGVLSVAPPPEISHAKIATKLMFWLGRGGWPEDQIMQAVGLRIPGPDRDGGRIPDVVLWSRTPPDDGVWFPAGEVLLVVEIVSRGSQVIDQVTKVDEYAAAGIPHYWTVARDVAQTVMLHRLTPEGRYEVATKVPLAWLLRTTPADHGLAP